MNWFCGIHTNYNAFPHRYSYEQCMRTAWIVWRDKLKRICICIVRQTYFFIFLQSCSHIHMKTDLLWMPTVIVDPQWPLTSGWDLWPPPEKGFQASLAGCSGQNNVSWCGDVHSPSVVSVRSNKHCGFQLSLLTAISYGASRPPTPHNSTLLTSDS